MTFFFYDLETSGIDPKFQRIMQFGGQRTDEDLKPIESPYQAFVKLTDEVLPEPEAIMVTGITPQESISKGISEAALTKHLNKDIFKPGTVVIGFNSIRFDDEFIRYLLYRNYHDPYLREWSDGRSRWDIIDLVRMTRALRPGGITWPVNEEGKPTNRLEELTKANNIEHSNAHDAIADVQATIGLARLVKEKQPKLFQHLLSMRDKKKVSELVYPGSTTPVVHTSGMLQTENCSTSVFLPLVRHPQNNNAILSWDLRFDPANWNDNSAKELAKLAFTNWRELKAADGQRLPVKAIHTNKSPAVAPTGVLDEGSQARIKLNLKQVESNLESLLEISDSFGQKIQEAWSSNKHPSNTDPDAMLYDKFISDKDKEKMTQIHKLNEDDLRSYKTSFGDQRLSDLWVRYKGRNFPTTLTDEERQQWEQYRSKRFNSGPGLSINNYMQRLKKLAEQNPGPKKLHLLEELQRYAESIAPYENQSLL